MEQWTRLARGRFVRLGRVGWVGVGVFSVALMVMAAWALLSWGNLYVTRPLDEIAYLGCLVFTVGCAVKAGGMAATSARASCTHRRWPLTHCCSGFV
jgi:diguanylate cyclase